MRFNEDDEALKRLIAFGKNKILKEDTDYLTEYIYALGQKADKKATKLIKDDLNITSTSTKEVLEARVYALGRIRQVDSIETLLQFSQSSNRGGNRRRMSPKMRVEVQTSLAILTGVELGDQLLDWTKWWSDNKRSFKISKTEGTISNARLQNKWKSLWLTEEQKAQAIKDFKEDRTQKRKDTKGDDADKGDDKKKKDSGDDGLIDF